MSETFSENPSNCDEYMNGLLSQLFDLDLLSLYRDSQHELSLQVSDVSSVSINDIEFYQSWCGDTGLNPIAPKHADGFYSVSCSCVFLDKETGESSERMSGGCILPVVRYGDKFCFPFVLTDDYDALNDVLAEWGVAADSDVLETMSYEEKKNLMSVIKGETEMSDAEEQNLRTLLSGNILLDDRTVEDIIDSLK